MSNKISEEDKKNFSEYVKCGNWPDAKMILYRSAGKPFLEVVPFDVAEKRFLHYLEQGSLGDCVRLLQQHSTLVKKNVEEIENIMKENRKNNELEFTENYFPEEQKHEVSKSEDELDDFELVEKHEEEDFEQVEIPKEKMPKLEQASLDLLSKELDDLNVSHPGGELKK